MEFLTVDTPNQTLFDYPADGATTWTPQVTPFLPMYDHLQMEREDVQFEMQTLRGQFRPYAETKVALVIEGGDGLSYSQMIHEMADDPQEWIFVSSNRLPAVLPSLGLEPHGGYHGLHTGFRNYRAFITAVGTAIGSAPMTVIDPPVSSYNCMRFELYKLIRGVSEWMVDVSQTPGAPNLNFPNDWLAGAENNIDFLWVFHFLFDFGFWWLQFMQARRKNDSTLLDLLWCEFVPSGRTMMANKTNYGFMAVHQVYLGSALHPDVAKLYHNTRCPPSPTGKTHVGVDWYPEELNLHIKADVTSHISRAQIDRKILEYPLTHTVHSGLTRLVYSGRKEPEAKLKKFDSDCNSVKKFLNEMVGDTWKKASKRNQVSKMGLSTRATSNRLPWDAMAKSMTHGSGGGEEHMFVWAARTIKRLAPWHKWQL